MIFMKRSQSTKTVKINTLENFPLYGMTETLLLKNNSIELQIFTVHTTKLNVIQQFTAIHMNWNGTSFAASPQT